MTDEEVEVPDTSYEALDRAAEILCKADLTQLSEYEHADLDLILAQLLNALYNRADSIADLSLVPGKVANSVLERTLTGYKEALELSNFIIKRLDTTSDTP